MVSKDCQVHKHPGVLLHFVGKGYSRALEEVTEYFVFSSGIPTSEIREPALGFKLVAEEEVSLPGWIPEETPLVGRRNS